MRPPGCFYHVSQGLAGIHPVHPRSIDLSSHAYKGGVLFDGQIKIGAGKNGHHVAGSQQLIVRGGPVVDGVHQAKGDQAGTQIVLVEPFDDRIFPIDFRIVLAHRGNHGGARVSRSLAGPRRVVALVV